MIALITGSRMFAAADVVNAALREVYDRALDIADARLNGYRWAWDRLYDAFGEEHANELVASWDDTAPHLTVRHGACPSRRDEETGELIPGADDLAHRWSLTQRHAVLEQKRPADWARYRNHAGPIRNRAMVDEGADLTIAFFAAGERHKGTRGCVELARDAGIPVWAFDEAGRLPLDLMPSAGRRHTRAVSA